MFQEGVHILLLNHLYRKSSTYEGLRHGLNKKDYFETLDIKSVTDNKMFWKTVAPLFSNKSKASNKITSENEKLIINDQKCAEVFNNYFNCIVEELIFRLTRIY